MQMAKTTVMPSRILIALSARSFVVRCAVEMAGAAAPLVIASVGLEGVSLPSRIIAKWVAVSATPAMELLARICSEMRWKN